MRTRPFWAEIVALSAALGCASAPAQAPADPAAPVDAVAPAPAAATGLNTAILEWAPPALTQLSSQALAKENFTLDRTMLAAAAGLLPDSDDDVKQAVAKLDGVSIHILRFAPGSAADPAQIDAIRQAYHLRGWKHVVSTAGVPSVPGAGGPDAGVAGTGIPGPAQNGGTRAIHDGTTDVWVVMDGANLKGAVVLVESPRSLTLATVAGNLSPVDLLHLRGHFGIPRFDANGLTGQAK